MFLWNKHCLKKRQHLIYLFSIIALLTGCYNDNTGPTEIKWDRHTCERCRMVISDKHFAVQVRGGPKNQVRNRHKITSTTFYQDSDNKGTGVIEWESFKG